MDIGCASWFLEHLCAHNEALAGDLLQEYRNGRSTGWYWRQVIAAILVSWWQEICHRPLTLSFVLLWSAVAPACDFWVSKIIRSPGLSEWMWKLHWPWSLLCAGAIDVTLSLTFLWVGMMVYLLGKPDMGWSISNRKRVFGGVFSGASAFIVSTGLLVLTLSTPVSSHALDKFGIVSAISPDTPRGAFDGKGIYDLGPIAQTPSKDGAKFTPLQFHVWKSIRVPESPRPNINVARTALDWIKDSGPAADIARLPYFLGLLFALWPASARLLEPKHT